MGTKLTIELDAGKYRAELNRVVQETRSAGQKLSQQAPKVDVKVSESGSEKTSAALKQLGQNAASATEQLSKGAGAISSLGGVAGQTGQKISGLSNILKAVCNPIALITAAVGAMASAAVAAWDRMTESAEEHAETLKQHAELAQKDLDETKAREQVYAGFASKLEQLTASASASDNVIRETTSILSVLQARYGDLGAEVDKTTGKILNFSEVNDRIRNLRGQNLAAKNEDLARLKEEEAKTAYMQMGGSVMTFTEAGAGEEFDSLQLGSLAGSGYMQQMADDAKTADKKAGYGKVAALLREAEELRKKASSARETGYETEDEAVQAKIEQAERNAREKKAKELRYKQIQARYRSMQDQADSANDAGSRETLADLQTPEEKEQFLRGWIERKKNQGEALDKTVFATNPNGSKSLKVGSESDEYFDYLQRRKKLDQDIHGLEAQIAKLQKEQAETGKEQAQAKQDLVASSQYEVDYQTLIAKGEYDKAAALKLEHDLKQKNLKLTDDERKALESVLQKQKAVSLAQTLSDKANSMAGRLAEQTGNGKAYAQQTALEDAAKRKGGSLSADEASLTKRLAAMEYDLSHGGRQAWDNVSGTEIVTNSLTARGGFASGAVVPDTEKVNKAIASDTKTIAAKLGELNTLQQEIKK